MTRLYGAAVHVRAHIQNSDQPETRTVANRL